MSIGCSAGAGLGASGGVGSGRGSGVGVGVIGSGSGSGIGSADEGLLTLLLLARRFHLTARLKHGHIQSDKQITMSSSMIKLVQNHL